LRYLALALFLFLSAAPGYGQVSVQFRACAQKDGSQAGMEHCASEEAATADAELDAVYQNLRMKAKQVPEALGKVEKAERTWGQFRDDYLEATFPAEDKQSAYGSLHAMNLNLLRATLTREHILQMKEMSRHYSEEGQ